MAMFDKEQLYASNGNCRVKTLFVDFGETPENILTLRDEPHKGYPSLQKLYVKYCEDDPSEAEFVEVVFGDFSFWERLKSSTMISPYIKEWQHEADVRRKSKAFKAIVKEVEDSGRNSFSAAKYLIQEPWKGTSKAARSESKKSSAEAAKSVSADVARISDYIRKS